MSKNGENKKRTDTKKIIELKSFFNIEKYNPINPAIKILNNIMYTLIEIPLVTATLYFSLQNATE